MCACLLGFLCVCGLVKSKMTLLAVYIYIYYTIYIIAISTLTNKTKCLSVVLNVCVCTSFLMQKAVITNVSPDVLYLFRVQAVCQHDLRSDFSQTLLFRGTRTLAFLHFSTLFAYNQAGFFFYQKNAYHLFFSKYDKNI